MRLRRVSTSGPGIRRVRRGKGLQYVDAAEQPMEDLELLALRHPTSGSWVDVKSTDIDGYPREATGGDDSANDFKTWSATVRAAIGLAVSTHAESPAARKRAVTRVVQEVADKLGNTPAVCHSSSTDPRIVDHDDQGPTIAKDLEVLDEQASYGPPFQGAIEDAVLALLREPDSATRLAG